MKRLGIVILEIVMVTSASLVGCKSVNPGGGKPVSQNPDKHFPLYPIDSPIVVRGGSTTALSTASSDWKLDQLGDGTVPARWKIDTGMTPNTFWGDGLDPNSTGSATDIGPITTATNWTIDFTFNNSGPTHLVMCTSLKNNACDPSPSGPLTGTLVYLETPNVLDNILGEDLDRKGTTGKKRLRISLSGCTYTASSRDNGLDPTSNHIKKLTVRGISGVSAAQCVDGACDIGISHTN